MVARNRRTWPGGDVSTVSAEGNANQRSGLQTRGNGRLYRLDVRKADVSLARDRDCRPRRRSAHESDCVFAAAAVAIPGHIMDQARKSRMGLMESLKHLPRR